MKISYSWLSTYIDLSPWQVDRVAEMLTEIGLEVEGVEKVESIPGGLVGVKVGEVTACESHPNADRLKVTKVNVGGGATDCLWCTQCSCWSKGGGRFGGDYAAFFRWEIVKNQKGQNSWRGICGNDLRRR